MEKTKTTQRISEIGIIGYILLGFSLFLLTLIFGVNWTTQPFIGRFIDQSLLVSPYKVIGLNLSSDFMQLDGFSENILMSINGENVRSLRDVNNVLNVLSLGEQVSIRIGDQSTREINTFTQILMVFPWIDRLSYLYFPHFLSFIFLVLAFWNYWVQKNSTKLFAFSFFSISFGIVLMTSFDIISTGYFSIVWIGALLGSGVSLVWLTSELIIDGGVRTMMKNAVLLLSSLSFITIFVFNNLPGLLISRYPWVNIVTGVCYLISLVLTLSRFFTSQNPSEKQRASLFMWTGLIGFGPIGIWLIGNGIDLKIPFSPWFYVPILVFPIAVGYLARQMRLLSTAFVINRSAQYGLLSIIVIFGYALLITGFGFIFRGRIATSNPILIGLVFFLLALIFDPLRNWLKNLLDKMFFRGQMVFRERLNTFSGDLTGLVNLDDILMLLANDIRDAVQPKNIHVYIFNSLTGYYQPQKIGGQVSSDLRFSVNSPLPTFLSGEKTPQYINIPDRMPDILKGEETKLKLLDAILFIPFQGQSRLLGWVAIGERLSGEAYSINEMSYLDALVDQASLAIERSQVIGNLESRVNEMNVLTRVAQGVNYTIELDDIFELIYAQTTQIIPTADFYLVLRDIHTDTFIQVFCVEEDERMFDREQRPLPPGITLEGLVTQSRRPLNISDYVLACRDQNAMVIRENIHATLIVPLNTGAQTIGTMIMAKRNPQERFTDEQMQLAQSIADQVAGAIEKARLLQETEKRAKQLATLNELTRQLSSTLELDPILENVLNNSVDILNCEAGSLLMVDEETDELVFTHVAGPVADDLLNKRLPKGAGIVGKSVKTREPVISNNVSNTPDWFSKTDKQTGFTTRSLLVVPLIVKNEVLGVIEVINRLDRLPFSNNDLEILTAFAAQASVALENASLYMRTDQALAERVEELSVMQRIDRELNTSLDLQRSMRITIEWALKQSGADAGLIGFVEESGIKLNESSGYTEEELEKISDGVISLDKFHIQDVIENGLPYQTRLKVDEKGILKNTRVQILIPIRRETQTIALLIMESTKPQTISDELMGFLQRLSDHASIAIVNGQLYAQVQSANIAKSEFVSFVAHELKNPMTSIKGYTELLAAGAVGAVNEAQGNFLGTIRSNIERMNTLVSDLNDLSKIEAGRLRLDFRAIKLRDVVEEVVRSTKRQIDDKQQRLEIELGEDLPQVWADSTRLSQVIVNLVSNAHKYTEAGGTIWISGEVSDNQWDPEGADQVVHLAVKDSGIGISEEDQKKIFTKFFRSEDPKTREVPGTGLGLNITRSLVEMQGGKIWFESQHRLGTTFHITVPISDVNH